MVVHNLDVSETLLDRLPGGELGRAQVGGVFAKMLR